MKGIVRWGIVVVLVLVACGALVLGNVGLLSLRKTYNVRYWASHDLRPTPVAFVDVTVIPMDSERVVPGQTVVVEDGLIAAVGPVPAVVVPDGATIVDGAGLYLMPGLTDMHVHVKQVDELMLYIANGVTGVREMWGSTDKALLFGSPDQLKLREQIAAGELVGPAIYPAGPIMEGEPPTSPIMTVFRTPEEARESVAWQAAQGYAFVKVYDHLTVETYDAIVAEAAAQGLPVIGHVPFAVGIDRVLAGGQLSIEHLTGYIDPDAGEFIIDEDEIEAYAAKTAAAGVWNCPTIVVYLKVGPPAYVAELEQTTNLQYIAPNIRLVWQLFSNQLYGNVRYEGDYPARMEEINLRMTRALHEAGAGLLLGTDTDNAFLVPGESAHEELGYLVKAGLTPFEALQAGTTNAAAALGRSGEVGMVAEGMRADLVLLRANPLEDVGRLTEREGVMAAGRYYDAATLRMMLDGIAGSYVPTLVERLWPVVVLLVVAGVVAVWRRT